MTFKISTILIILQLFGFNDAFGQSVDLNVESIIKKRIDSIVVSIDSNRNCKEVIAEGTIKNKKHFGGFSTYYLQKDVTNKLLRIRDYRTIGLYYKNTFYYDDDKLIYVTIEIEDWNSKKIKTIYSSKYYFNNDVLLISYGENKKYSNATDILFKGKNYLLKRYQELKEDDELFDKLRKK